MVGYRESTFPSYLLQGCGCSHTTSNPHSNINSLYRLVSLTRLISLTRLTRLTQMAASFRQTLPADLILLIISLIDVVHEKKTLVALSRVSKHFNALTAPYLYSNFIQTEQSSRKKLLLFLRTILATPHLGRYVKTYTSESCDPRPPLVNMRDVGGPSDIVNFKKAIRNYAIHPHAPDYKWISDALAAKWDALVAILLCVLPNLHTITLQQYYSRDGYPYIEAVLKRAAAWQQSQSSTSRQVNQ